MKHCFSAHFAQNEWVKKFQIFAQNFELTPLKNANFATFLIKAMSL